MTKNWLPNLRMSRSLWRLLGIAEIWWSPMGETDTLRLRLALALRLRRLGRASFLDHDPVGARHDASCGHTWQTQGVAENDEGRAPSL